MSKASFPVLALLLVPLAAKAVLPAHKLPRAEKMATPGEVLVRFKADGNPALKTGAAGIQMPGDGLAAVALKSRLGLSRRETLLEGRIERLTLPGYLRVEDAVAQLAADPSVQWAEPNYRKTPHEVLPDDPRFNEQWPLKNTGQADAAGPGLAGADMALTLAWDANNDGVADRTDASSVKLAVVDDGFQLGHPDLAGNFIQGRDFLASGGEDTDPSPGRSEDIHGTLVSGSAGAVGNNGIGIASPAWKVQLMPLRFAYDTASEVKAMDYARSQGVKVVNASYGGPEFSNAEHDAIERLRDADILLVASAGNLDSNTDLAKAAYPANFNLANIVAVAANDRRDNLAGFTQYGPMTVDVAAPGVRVLTTAVGSAYTTVSGTSFSAPYTAAVAALIRANYPSADVSEVKARLIEGAAAGNGIRNFTVGGRVDADASLDLAARPSLVIQNLVFDDSASGDGDRALDPGERADVVVTFENLWAPASNLNVSLVSNSSNITQPSGSPASSVIVALAKGATTTLRFPIVVAATASQQEVADLKFVISGAGYSAERHFNAQLGKLTASVVTNSTFSSNIRDEFHTWQFDLPNTPTGYSNLRVRSTASPDIDIIVKRGAPPEYEISLGVDPESSAQTFYTDVPGTQVGGEAGGNETVNITNPVAGTWFVTVVNYTQSSNTPYTLVFETTAASGGGSSSSSGGSSSSSSSGGTGGGGGGGAVLAWPLLLALLRRRHHC